MHHYQYSIRQLGVALLMLVAAGPVLHCECEDQSFSGVPMLRVDNTVLQFEHVAVGYPQSQVLNIWNDGKKGLVFNKLEIDQTDSAFSILGMLDAGNNVVALPTMLGPDRSMQIVVQYSPKSEDALDLGEILVIDSNDPDLCPSEDNPCQILLTGTGAPPDAQLAVVCQEEETCPGGSVPVCRVILDQTNTHPVRIALNFCEVAQGSSRTLGALLKNVGNIPLMMGSDCDQEPSNGCMVRMDSLEDCGPCMIDCGQQACIADGSGGQTCYGDCPEGFTIDQAPFSLLQPKQTNLQLAPGEESMLRLVFAPTQKGAHSGGFSVLTNDLDLVFTNQQPGDFVVRMIGLSAQPDIDVTPTTITFSGIAQGDSGTEEISITNTGDAILVIQGIEVAGGSVIGEYSVQPQNGFEVAPGASESVQVTYAPTDVGSDDGSVIVYSNDPDEPKVVVALGGDVRPDLDVSPSTALVFEGVEPGGQTELNLSLRNVGYAELTIDDIYIQDNPQDAFALLDLPVSFPAQAIQLAPAESLDLTVRFADNTQIANETSQLSISHNSPNDQNPYHVMLLNSGTATNLKPVALVDPPAQVVHGLDRVSVSAHKSFDPDPGDRIVRYQWSFLFQPQDAQGNRSQASLDSTDQTVTTFTPDMEGKYVIRLHVFDSSNAMSDPVDAEISVNP